MPSQWQGQELQQISRQDAWPIGGPAGLQGEQKAQDPRNRNPTGAELQRQSQQGEQKFQESRHRNPTAADLQRQHQQKSGGYAGNTKVPPQFSGRPKRYEEGVRDGQKNQDQSVRRASVAKGRMPPIDEEAEDDTSRSGRSREPRAFQRG